MTQNELKEIFEYVDGTLFWKTSPRYCIRKGDPAGALNDDGYLKVKKNGKTYLLHRIIFLYHNGYLPKEIDHKDGDKLNNRINNLRDATRSQNGANKKKYVTNKSGFKGVCWYKETKRWKAQINVNKKKINLGYFTDALKAHEAYKTAALIHFKEFANV